MATEKGSEHKSGRQISGQKSSEGGRGHPEKASPAAVERYLKNIDFPASKDELVKHAEGNNAPDDVMSVLGRFSDKDYNSVIDVAKEVGRVDKEVED